MSNSIGGQSGLFDEFSPAVGDGGSSAIQTHTGPAGTSPPLAQVQAWPPQADHRELATRLDALFGQRWHFGTSSWHFPGWAGIVYAGRWPASNLSRHGLLALASHPLLRSVS
jgi:hypothetical protein